MFRLRRDKDYHLALHINMEMTLATAGIKMVSQFPIDIPISALSVLNISDNLFALRYYIPRQYARKPRTMIELPRWKATEFRQLLLYTGIIVLKDKIPTEIYDHFLLLHCACRIFNSDLNDGQLKQIDENICWDIPSILWKIECFIQCSLTSALGRLC